MTISPTITARAAADLAAFRAAMDKHSATIADLLDGDSELREDVLEDADRRGLVTLGNFDAAQDDEAVIFVQGGELMWAATIDRHHYVIGENGAVEDWDADA